MSRRTLASGLSCCRNSTLMRLMSLVPLPLEAGSPAEGNGSGIPMMIQSCKEHGLKEPLLCPGIDQFKVILFRPNWDAGIDGTPYSGQEAGGRSTRVAEETIQGLLAKYGEMSVHELQEQTGLNINQVRNRLRKLIAAGKVVPTAPPSSKKRAYRTASIQADGD